jgi:DNA-directed RNA polymerase specialized sigma24 family protein
MTEQDVLDCIERVVLILGPRFLVPGCDCDDIAQEARMMALECLPRYRPEVAPLENFVMSHVKRRLINYKRDHHKRCDSPCRSCYNGRPCGPDGRCCEAHLKWEDRQARKAKVTQPGQLVSDPTRESDVEADAEERDMLRVVDEYLPIDLRRDYLRMRSGCPVTKARREAVMASVKEILAEVLDPDEP